MKTSIVFVLTGVALLAAGCAESARSISHSDPRVEDRGFFGPSVPVDDSDPDFRYRGELSEFDVLGIDRGGVVTDAEIQTALTNAAAIRLKPGSSILLVQSGALFPDGPMVSELGKYFRVVPFSGIPSFSTHIVRRGQYQVPDATGNFSRSLRLAAARGGNDTILCYWGVFESANEKLATKTISWMPVADWIVPDEREHMRIRLKLALIDVRTGNWAVLSPEPMDDSRISRSPRRTVADQKLVETLKQRAYVAGTKALLREYSTIAMNN